MTEPPKRQMFAAHGVAAPLRHMVFRRIWLASLLSNLGLLIQGVGAAWAMTQMTCPPTRSRWCNRADAASAADAAGAIADMYDRRIVALVSLSIALLAQRPVLAAVSSPRKSCCRFLFHRRQRQPLFGPAWQSSVSEQVPAEPCLCGGAQRHQLQHRAKFRPTIGSIVVATAGAVAASQSMPCFIFLCWWCCFSGAAPANRRNFPVNALTAPSCRACAISPTRPRSVSCWDAL
jgi:hypothetical protein